MPASRKRSRTTSAAIRAERHLKRARAIRSLVIRSSTPFCQAATSDEGIVGRDLRLYPKPFSAPGQEGTVAVCLKSGSICFLPIMPGYIGTLHVRDGQAVSLSFEISAQLREPLHITVEQRRRLDQRRATAAALAA